MKSRNRLNVSSVVLAGVALVATSIVASACHLVNGIDDFSTDPGLDIVRPPPCATESDCPGMNTECGKSVCESNVCSSVFEAKGTVVLQQVVGDCKVNQCDGAGNRVDDIVDPSDVFDDGKECTIDACSAMGLPTNEPAMAGTSCAMGTQVCDGKGACVECASDTNCAMNLVCYLNHCVVETCTNQTKDVAESDVDCGGPDCQPCATGKLCMNAADCESKTCTAGMCAVPTCDDVQKNGEETDVDCGGPTCNACAAGSGCVLGSDCTSMVCKANACQMPACDDGVQNGTEVDVDCGGTCGTCPDGSKCVANGDCNSEFCLSGTCAKIVQVATGTTHACAVVQAAPGDGKLYCWGGNNFGELGAGAMGTMEPRPMDSVNLTNVTSVSTFSNTTGTTPLGGHTCARSETNGVAKFACWGRNENGQLGNNSMAASIQPVDIAFAAGITPVQVVAGGRHTCAITANGHVQCWGSNGHGQCGTGTTMPPRYSTPQSVLTTGLPNPMGAVQLALGTVHTCARLASGDVACWGYDESGQVGISFASDQVRARKLTTISQVTQLATGQDFTCGLTNSGVFCWGDDSDKQFGEGIQTSPTTPLKVQNVAAILPLPLSLGASGAFAVSGITGGHACYIIIGGKLVCLGLNDRGQVAPGNPMTPIGVPTEVTIDPVKQVSLGTQFTCALLEKGALRCWGRNDFGQLGNGSTGDSTEPVPVAWP